MDLYAGTEAPRSFKLPRKATKVLRLASGLALLSTMFLSSSEESLGNVMRRLCHLEVTFDQGEEVGPIGVWTEVYGTEEVDYYERALKPQDPIVAESEADIAFVITMLECPDQPFYEQANIREKVPPNVLFYDHMAMLKYSICGEIDTVKIGNIERHATMYALLPGDAVECMGANEEPFDRVRILEELGFIVKIIGSPVKKVDIGGSPFLRENIMNDVGVKDLIKVQAFNMTTHPLAVLIDYDTFLLESLTEAFQDHLTRNVEASFAMDYTPTNDRVQANNRGINTGLFIFRPSTKLYEDLIELYTTSAFDPENGWGGQSAPSGITGFPGAMGTKGLLTYYYSLSENANKMNLLNKCRYNNQHQNNKDSYGNCRDGTTADCEDCRETPFEEIVAVRLDDQGCTLPYSCNPTEWDETHHCHLFHQRWFEDRLLFETKHYFTKFGRRAKRAGNFHPGRTMNYCYGPGTDNYEKIIPDATSGPIMEPEIVLPKKDIVCDECGDGEFVTYDADNGMCSCTSDACAACPEGTRCQEANPQKGIPALCLDCTCGFCDKDNIPCCDFNGVNNCKSHNTKKECLAQNGFFPGMTGKGHVCSGVEISATATPNGCGCQPNKETHCTYDVNDQDVNDKCFIMNSNEILTSTIDAFSTEDKEKANECRQCILTECSGVIYKKKPAIQCLDEANDVDEMQSCMGNLEANGNGDQCRAKCQEICRWD